MPSQSGSDFSRARLVVAGTAHFAKLEDSDLLQVPDELNRISSTFAVLGYDPLPVLIDPDHEGLRKLFAEVKKSSKSGDLVIAYYTGHGARDAERFYLLARNSDLAALDETALAAEDLARALTKQSQAAQVLIILDTCYAAAGSAEVAAIANRLTVVLGGDGPATFIIAAARAKQEAGQGALSLALEQTLTNRDERLGGRAQRFLAIDEVMGAIDDYLRQKHPAQTATWSSVNVQGRCRLFPNPHFRQELRAGLDLESQRAFAEHWLPKARGAELGVAAWYFTGREEALRELATWLRQPSSDGYVRVVTGGPGAGKSALLARLVTLSNPEYRQQVLGGAQPSLVDPTTLPPERVVSVAVHARKKLLSDVVEQIAHGIQVAARDPAELVQVLEQRSAKTVIVLDALDESDDRIQLVTQLLVPLARMPHVFLLVGTRPDSVGPGRRFRGFGDSAVEIDLDQPHYAGDDDVARYVERRLLATEEPRRTTPYRGSPLTARKVAHAIAERAENVFLVAHTAVLALLAAPSIVNIDEPGWIDDLPTGLDDAFARFLDELNRQTGGVSPAIVRAVLLPLAFAEGEGLPWLALWSAVASAISGFQVDDTDIARVREQAAPFIVEGMEHDRSVYRLYHERISENLRASTDVRVAQRQFVKSLRAQVSVRPGSQDPDWSRAHPYVLTHLLAHAFKAGDITELIADGAFVAAADPVRTLRTLLQSTEPLERRAAAAYTLAFGSLRQERKDDRLSYLEMAARKLGDDQLVGIWTTRRESYRWSVPWASWSPMTPHRAIAARTRVTSIAVGVIEDRSVVVTGGEDGTVQIWDLALGSPYSAPFLGHDGAVHSVALATVDGRSLVISGGHDKTIRVWDVISHASLGEPLVGHDHFVNSVTVGTVESRSVIVSGSSDGTARIWDLLTGAPLKPTFSAADTIGSVAVGAIEDRPVIVAGGWENTLHVWDAISGAARSEQLTGHEHWVSSIVVTSSKGRQLIVSGGWDGTIRKWDLLSGAPLGKPLLGHDNAVHSPISVSVGTLDGRQVIISGGAHDRTVRVWDLSTGTPCGGPLRGHSDDVTSVSLGSIGDQSVIVSGGHDRTVRVWDPRSVSQRKSLTVDQHAGWVISVTIATLDDSTVIVTGGEDGTIRTWDRETGRPIGKPMREGEHGKIFAVTAGSLQGRPVIIAGGEHSLVRVWDLASRTPLTKLAHPSNADQVYSIALSTLEGLPVVVGCGSYPRIHVWDLASGALIREQPCTHNSGATALAVGQLDGRSVIVSGGWEGIVQVRDLSSGALCSEPFQCHHGAIASVVVHTVEDRPTVFTSGSDGTVRMWDLATGAPRGQSVCPRDKTATITIGTFYGQTMIVSGGIDGSLQIWDTQGREHAAVHIGTTISRVACASDETVIVAGFEGLMALHFTPDWRAP